MTSIEVRPDLRGAALAQAAAEYLSEHPEEWDQGTWGQVKPGCGTRACLGGTGALISGEAHLEEHETGYMMIVETSNPRYGSIRAVAERVFELSWEEAEDLFYGPWQYDVVRPELDEDDDDRYDYGTPVENRVKNLWAKMTELYGDQITVPEQYR